VISVLLEQEWISPALSPMIKMKVLLLLPLLLTTGCSAQSGDLLKELLSDGSLNLCGSGGQPSTCTCADGTTFTPGNQTKESEGGPVLRPIAGRRGPCGDCSLPTSCICPDGSQPEIPSREEVTDQLKDKVVNSESNPCGSGNEVTCTCADGASFTPRDLIEKKECGKPPGNPCADRSRPVCSCPNGEALEKAGLRTLLQQVAQG